MFERVQILITETGSGRVARRITSLGDEAIRTARGINTLRGALYGIGATAAISGLVATSNSVVNMQNKLLTLTGSVDKARVLFDELGQAAIRSRSGFDETVTSFYRISNALEGYGYSGRDVIGMSETLNKLFISTGLSTAEAASSMYQLSQAFNKGKLDGDEFRTVAEASPKLLKLMAAEAGVTTEKLEEMRVKGQLSTTLLAETIRKNKDEIDRAFQATSTSISQAVTKLEISFKLLYEKFDRSTGATQVMVGAIDYLRDNLETFSRAAIAVAGTIATVLLPSLLRVGARLIAFAGMATPFGRVALGIAALTSSAIAFGDTMVLNEKTGLSFQNVYSAAVEVIGSDIAKLTAKASGMFTDILAAANINTGMISEIMIKSLLLFLSTIEKIVKGVIGVFSGAWEAAKSFFNRDGKSAGEAFKTGFMSVYEGNYILDTTKRILDKSADKALDDMFERFQREQAELEKQSLLDRKDKRTKETPEERTGRENAESFDKEFTKLMQEGEALKRLGMDRKIYNEQLAVSQKLKRELTQAENDAIATQVPLNEAARIRSDLLTEILPKEDERIKKAAILKQLLDEEKISQADYVRIMADMGGTFESHILRLDQEANSYRLIGTEKAAYLEQLRIEQDLKRSLTDQEKALNLEKVKNAEQAKLEGEILNSIQSPMELYKQQLMALNALKVDGAISQEQYNAKLAEFQLRLLEAQPAAVTFADGVLQQLQRMQLESRTILGDLGKQFSQIFGPGGTLASGIGDAVAQTIVFGKSFKDQIRGVAQSIVSQLISSLVKVGITMVQQALLGQTTMAGITASAGAQATAVGAAWAPAAGLASLATGGANAAGASTAITTILSLVTALAGSLFSGKGFSEGGYTGPVGVKQLAGFVHGQEFVVNAKATRKHRSTLEALNAGRDLGGAVMPAPGRPVSVSITNEIPEAAYEARQVDEDTVEIIARRIVRQEAAEVVAHDLRNPNSRMQKSLSQNTTARRRR